jgi:(E)-4-hydroxy-3-methylbut-2-enyl-diphosphate synthase
MKSSNTRVMVHAYRLLVEAMDSEDMHYPIHLGVTEAGNGIEGRIKSAVGIGALLADGIGDTIRVSLTEAPENEIPVAQMLVEHFAARNGEFTVKYPERYSPTEFRRRSNIQTPIVHSEVTDDFLILDSRSANPTAETVFILPKSCVPTVADFTVQNCGIPGTNINATYTNATANSKTPKNAKHRT